VKGESFVTEMMNVVSINILALWCRKKALVFEANFMQQNLVDIRYLGPMFGNV